MSGAGEEVAGVIIKPVEDLDGEVLSRHRIEPNKTYWRNEMREPGRWPGSQK